MLNARVVAVVLCIYPNEWDAEAAFWRSLDVTIMGVGMANRKGLRKQEPSFVGDGAFELVPTWNK
jgi:hypothetical protein